MSYLQGIETDYIEKRSDTKGRVWNIMLGDVEKETLVKKVVFVYGEERRSHVCFYIDYMSDGTKEAFVIDNGDWDLMCFAIDYDRESVVRICEDYASMVEGWSEVAGSAIYDWNDWDAVMEDIS